MTGMPSHNWIGILPGSVSRKAMAYDQVDYRVMTKTQVDCFTVRSNIVMCKKKIDWAPSRPLSRCRPTQIILIETTTCKTQKRNALCPNRTSDLIIDRY
jgi:hypothetical protein